jgi:hypothetical protein
MAPCETGLGPCGPVISTALRRAVGRASKHRYLNRPAISEERRVSYFRHTISSLASLQSGVDRRIGFYPNPLDDRIGRVFRSLTIFEEAAATVRPEVES